MIKLKDLIPNKNFWFSYGFSVEKKKWIIENASKVKCGLSCQDISLEWLNFLKKEQPEWDVEAIEGFYYPYGDFNNAEGHMWLEIGGNIFDPTASQFDDFPNLDDSNYEQTG